MYCKTALVTLSALFLHLGYGNALAVDECDIIKFKDEISYTKDVVTNLAYIRKSLETSSESSNPNFSISFLDIVSLGYSDAQKASTSLEKLLNVNYSQSDREWLLISQLTDKGLKAYTQCLKDQKQNFSVTLSNGAEGKQQFFAVVYSHPFFDAPNPQRLSFSLLGGKLTGPPPKTIRTQQKLPVTIKRDSLYEPLELAVSVGNDSLEPNLSLPALPKKEYQVQVRRAEYSAEVYGGNDELAKRLCVTLGNDEQDAMIVPKTLKFQTSIDIQHNGDIIEDKQKRVDNDTREVCAVARWHISVDTGRIKGTATVTATVLKAVPVKTSVIEAKATEPSIENWNREQDEEPASK